MFGSDAMAREFDEKAPTYRMKSKAQPPKNLEKPF
jgi:hypothetical protein